MNPNTAIKRPWTLAAPSCVLPAGIAENCAFLAQEFDEIALAFFETEACLAYTEQEFPAELAQLPVSWHMHLPLDLPWAAGVGGVAAAVLGLRDRAAHVAPGHFVLHPPREPQALAELAQRLEAGGIAPGQVLVENINGRDLALHWPVIEAFGLGVCLDLGHMLVHGQQEFLALPGLAARTRMLHLNAPDPARPSHHAALSALDAAGRALCGRLLDQIAPGGVVVLELFNENALFNSLTVLDEILAGRKGQLEAHA
ncbi:cobamide remodeling phosphodiesterase CbiR [Humidesulfovibrio idahonensis]